MAKSVSVEFAMYRVLWDYCTSFKSVGVSYNSLIDDEKKHLAYIFTKTVVPNMKACTKGSRIIILRDQTDTLIFEARL